MTNNLLKTYLALRNNDLFIAQVEIACLLKSVPLSDAVKAYVCNQLAPLMEENDLHLSFDRVTDEAILKAVDSVPEQLLPAPVPAPVSDQHSEVGETL